MAKTANGVVLEGEAYEKILYVSKDRLESLSKMAKDKKAKITDKCIEELVYPEDLEDEQMLVPIDVSEAGDDFPTNAEEMIQKLGAEAAAQALLHAAKLFQKSKAKFNKNEQPIEMTVGEWMSLASIEEGEEEEDADGDEEEEEEEGEEEDEVEDEVEDDSANKENEPDKKKRKKA